jgi:hypothetical protein
MPLVARLVYFLIEKPAGANGPLRSKAFYASESGQPHTWTRRRRQP